MGDHRLAGGARKRLHDIAGLRSPFSAFARLAIGCHGKRLGGRLALLFDLGLIIESHLRQRRCCLQTGNIEQSDIPTAEFRLHEIPRVGGRAGKVARAAAPRTYATIGVEGLAPYWFEIDAAAFLSTEGELTARVGAYYDQRVTQRLILQPRVELDLAAQDVPAAGIGAGLNEAELGLRLRYEIAREFAPYVGVSWRRKTGRSADYARASGEDAGGAALVLGIRAWF